MKLLTAGLIVVVLLLACENTTIVESQVDRIEWLTATNRQRARQIACFNAWFDSTGIEGPECYGRPIE